ncbi:MAG: hypothetical protein II623_02070 [Paludibacteraceae bacterium]|nr:hypothetical protein [Paludibacteraceae bacterium]MBR6042529.1 hypothetical protein [Paludibacteraceae bacterium]
MTQLLRRTIFFLLGIVAFATANAQYIICNETDSFAYRQPIYNQIDLVCGDAPDTTNSAIVSCFPAAFSALIKPDFDHINVAGWHISGGNLHKGFPCRNNTGGFVYYKNRKWKILNKEDYDKIVQEEADNIQCAYGQCLVIYNKEVQEKFPRGPEWVAQYRVLCDKQGKLFFFETKYPMPRGRFMQELEKLDLDNALYMEMGQDYNHGWWRNEDGSVNMQHAFYRGSNWIIFKQ